MKKIIIIIIIINIIGIIIGSVNDPMKTTITNSLLEKDRLEMIKEKGVITIAAPPMEVPFFSVNPKTKEMSGIDADIIKEIIRRLGINKIEVREANFSNLLEKFIADGSIDISLGGMFITAEDEKLVAFTKPLYKETEVVIVPIFSRINFMSDLKNSVVGVERGTIFVDLVKKWKEDNLIKDILILDSTTEIFNAINNKEIDAAVADSIIMKYHLLNEKKATLRMLKYYTPELQGIIGIAAKKDDVTLLNVLNNIIKDMNADGTLYAILVKHGLDKSNMINE